MNTNPDSTDARREEADAPSESTAADTVADATPIEPATPEATPAEAAPTEAAPAEAEPPQATPTESTEVKPEATHVEAEPAEVTMAEATTPTEAVEKPTDKASTDTVDKAADEDTGKTTDDATDKEVAAAVDADPRLGRKVKNGERVDVKLIQVGDKDAFLDWGGPSEGTIATAELKNEKGELRVNAGDEFTAIVREAGDTVIFTVGRGKGGDLLRMRELQSAMESKIPVPGKIRSTNKGGFEVDLGGVRAFCPFSQIDTIYCDDPSVHVGKEYPFEVITFERSGRNIVVSRRNLVAAEQKEKAVETRAKLEVGQELTGTVRRLQPYGAFVDIGGMDGLVHVSEISRTHINDPKDVLKVGQKVDVKVVALDNLGTRKERVSLSIKALAPDPWKNAAETWKVGTTVKGKVVRMTDFGAFVELAPGIDGLLHVSQISSERIAHPGDVLKAHQEVEVRILDIDPGSHRISMTMRPEGEEAPTRGGGGGGGSRGPRRSYGGERSPMEYSSSAEETQESVDVSGMDFDDALAELKKKFDK